MNPTPDTAAAGNGGRFDPRQAAALLDQTTWQARRIFASGRPLLWMFRAVVALVAFGGFWLSVRGHQIPYSGPSGWAVPVAAVFVATNIVWSTVAIKRAGAGVSGPAQRRKQAWLGAMLVAWIAAYAFTVPLYHGAAHQVWGLYPASAPLMFIGLLGALTAAARKDRTMAVTTLAIAIMAAVAGFGGPAGAWLIMGIGLSATMLCAAAFSARQQSRGMVRP
ncbi:MAG: hypothetical protein ACRDRJ_07675 [Streptosporangiaceae bacterium]